MEASNYKHADMIVMHGKRAFMAEHWRTYTPFSLHGMHKQVYASASVVADTRDEMVAVTIGRHCLFKSKVVTVSVYHRNAADRVTTGVSFGIDEDGNQYTSVKWNNSPAEPNMDRSVHVLARCLSSRSPLIAMMQAALADIRVDVSKEIAMLRDKFMSSDPFDVLQGIKRSLCLLSFGEFKKVVAESRARRKELALRIAYMI